MSVYSIHFRSFLNMNREKLNNYNALVLTSVPFRILIFIARVPWKGNNNKAVKLVWDFTSCQGHQYKLFELFIFYYLLKVCFFETCDPFMKIYFSKNILLTIYFHRYPCQLPSDRTCVLLLLTSSPTTAQNDNYNRPTTYYRDSP